MRNNHEFYDTWSQLIWFQPCTSKLFFVTNIWHGVIQKCFLKRKWWRHKFIVKCKQQISEKNSPTHHKIFLADHQGNHLTFYFRAVGTRGSGGDQTRPLHSPILVYQITGSQSKEIPRPFINVNLGSLEFHNWEFYNITVILFHMLSTTSCAI